MSTHYKPLIIALPVDFGPPIYYSPEEEFTLLLSQLLTAILAGVQDLDRDQISVALNEVKNFIDSKWDRKAIYSGSGSTIILPNAFKSKSRFIMKIKEIFDSLGIPLTIKFWDEFGVDYKLVIFGMDMMLRNDNGITSFVENLRTRIEIWNQKVTEYFEAGLIVTEKDRNKTDDRFSEKFVVH